MVNNLASYCELDDLHKQAIELKAKGFATRYICRSLFPTKITATV